VTEQIRDAEYRRFLSRAADELGSSLDYEQTLATVARLAVPTLADWCAVDLAVDGGTRRVAVAHVDPDKLSFIAELERRYPPRPDEQRGVRHILSTGEPELMSDIPRDVIRRAAVDEQHLRLIERLDLRSYVGVPLLARGKALGVFSFVMAESGRRYTEKDLEYAQALADRAALAIDNARLFLEVEKDRAASEETFRLLVEGVKDYAFIMLDPSGRVTTWNAGARLITGWAREEIVGQHVSRLYPAEDAAGGAWERELAIARREGRFEVEAWRVRKDGSRYWSSITLSPVTDERGALRGFAKVTRDLTERKRAQEQLEAEVARRRAGSA
jgi:PAS domain S-box-containing protein